MKPMLLTAAPSLEEALAHPNAVVQPKLDGRRCIFDLDRQLGFGRNGQRMALPGRIFATLLGLNLPAFADGELVDGVFHVFDLIPKATTMVFGERMKALGAFGRMLDVPEVRVVDVVGRDEAPAFVERMRDEKAEGVVIRRLDSVYEPGLRSRKDFKARFFSTVDCIVAAIGDSPRNATLAVFDGDHLIEVGRVGRLSGDGPKLKVGDVVEVKVAAVTKGRRLYHPTLPRLRTDKDPWECTSEQLDGLGTGRFK